MVPSKLLWLRIVRHSLKVKSIWSLKKFYMAMNPGLQIKFRNRFSLIVAWKWKMYHKANMIFADQLKIRLPIAIALLSGMITTPRGGVRKKILPLRLALKKIQLSSTVQAHQWSHNEVWWAFFLSRLFRLIDDHRKVSKENLTMGLLWGLFRWEYLYQLANLMIIMSG